MAIVIGNEVKDLCIGWTDSSCCRSDKAPRFVMQSEAPARRRSGSIFNIE